MSTCICHVSSDTTRKAVFLLCQMHIFDVFFFPRETSRLLFSADLCLLSFCCFTLGDESGGSVFKIIVAVYYFFFTCAYYYPEIEVVTSWV